MKIKRWVAALLCVLLIGSLFPTRAFAADNIASGTGWNLSDDGVLHITGAIESGFNLTDEQKQQVKSAVAASGASISSGENLFSGFKNMTSADLSNLNTTDVTNMSFMFMECISLTSLDVSGFDTSSVTNMSYMFMSCSSLTSLDVSGFDTSSVTDMSYMFYGCSSLTSLSLSNFNTSNFNTSSVTTMAGMFSGCSSLTSLDVSGFNTSSVTYMFGMFTNCSSLTSLNLSSFDTSSVESMSSMFSGCSSLTSLDLSEFKTGKVTNMGGMFYNCSGLTSLNLSSFDTSSVDSMRSMFEGCSSLTSLDVSGFKPDKLMDADGMFLGCSALTSLGISPAILSENADNIIAIRSSWQKQGSTDTYSTADELKAVTDTVTLLAMYTVNVQNDGNGTASANPAAAVKGDTVTLTATPDTGYHFKEWQSSDVTVSNNTFTMPEQNVTVKAIFEADAPTTYTVTFNMNGHGTQITAQSVESGSKATKLDNPAASGWTFGGWYADATFSTKFDFNTAITADTTIYAKWTEITVPQLLVLTTYTVSFNMNGHGTQVAGQTVEDGNKATKPDDPAASGWTFGGWYADATFSAKFDFNTAITANTTVYAKWTEIIVPQPPAPTYTIIAGTGGEWTKGSKEGLLFTSDADFDKFDSVQVDGSTIAAANYTAEEGSTKITLALAYLETLSTGSHSIKIVSKDGSASTNFTVKAAAQPPVPAKYTVSFNMNGHGTQVAGQTVEDGNKATKPDDPAESDWTFGGWYADATFSTKFDFNTAITANTTAYAKWTKNSAAPADPISPQTGDTSDMFLWIALLLVSCGALVGTTVYSRKKKYNAK